MGYDQGNVVESKRSGGVVFLGILAIVVGMGLLLVTILPLIIASAFKEQSSAQMSSELRQKMEAVQNEPMMKLLTYTAVGLNSGIGLALTVASIGILRVRPWGWKLAVALLSAYLAWAAADLAIKQLVIAPHIKPVIDEWLASPEMKEMPPAAQKMTRFFAASGGNLIVALCCCIPPPLILFIGLLTPGIRMQFFPPPEDSGAPRSIEG